ncbi:SWIM zinc finger family protein [Polymorphospora sp. NPDC050346]|uniref:SWIM zinc finger family protein n=1 Tax=Polymorphospora sp. NPDC050346 TaxID=3155780 RepID=UPI0033EB2122
MSEVVTDSRWSTEQVLALAPDASSQKAGRGLATLQKWHDIGHDGGGEQPGGVWGLCKGSGSKPYQTCVDLAEPAYRCSCPSRKFPCKHALALLLLWADGKLAAGEPPEWVREWRDSRAARVERAKTRQANTGPADPAAAARTAKRRADRVTAGLDELDTWLADQVRAGLAGAGQHGYKHWDSMAARLVDAQASTAASTVKRLAGFAVGQPADALLTELALLRMLVAGHRRLDDLPPGLAATVRQHVGYPTSTEEVLATPATRDKWLVLGRQDEAADKLTVRRVWLRGRQSARPALVLAFAAPGQALNADLVPGTVIDADICFYPGGAPLRALVSQQHGVTAGSGTGDVSGSTVAAALDDHAAALAADPWLDRWPVLLDDVVVAVADGRWHVIDAAGDALPLQSSVEPWVLVAVAGGRPVRVAAVWTPTGLQLMTAWLDGKMVAL